MKEKMKWNDYDSLPLILDVTDIQHIMGISEPVLMSWYTHRGFRWCAAAG